MKVIDVFLFAALFLFSIPISGQATYFVNADATSGNQDGTSWTDAFTNLHDALNAAFYGDEIWVAQGTYFPATDNRQTSFYLKNGIRLYGGFEGTETSLSQRNWKDNVTILSGDIGTPGDSLDNSFTIMQMNQPDTATLLDGFTFLHGNADGDIGDDTNRSKNGGAIYIGGFSQMAYPRIFNCHFENNTAALDGGAVYIGGPFNASYAPQFFNCTFYGNRAGRHGGGLAKHNSSSVETKGDFLYCTFEQNFAGHDGGGIFYFESEDLDTFDLYGCKFLDNTAISQGGGISLWGGRFDGGSRMVIRNCEFDGNIAVEREGSGIHYIAANFLDVGLLHLDSCVFRNTPSTLVGECFYVDALNLFGTESKIAVTNCQFKNNATRLITIDCYDVDSLLLQGNLFENNHAEGFGIFASGAKSFHITHNAFIKNGPADPSLPTGMRLFAITLIDRVTCANNLFFDNLIVYDGLVGQTGIDTLTNCLIWNRLDTDSQDDPFGGLSTVVNVHLLNSIVIVDSLFGSFETLGATHVYLENTAITSADCPVLPGPTSMLDEYPPFVICGNGTLFAPDPLLADTANGDFGLHPCSEARNAGNNDFAVLAGLLKDMEGNLRISEGAVDLGPFETLPYGLATEDLTDTSCEGDTTGTLVVEVQSGCPPYTFDLNGNVSTVDSFPLVLTGLQPGLHKAKVTDFQGRTDSFDIIIETIFPLTITALPSDVDCHTGQFGDATAVYSGGTGKVGYEWSTGSTSAWIINQPPGEYAITVTDALGCTAVDSFEIVLVGDMDVSGYGEDISCFGEMDGIAWAEGAGSEPFTWLWENGTTEMKISGLSDGEYAVTVTDQLGCTGETTVSIIEPDTMHLDATVTHATGATNADGAISVTDLMGGTPGYSFEWNTGDSTMSLQNLPPGEYSLTVTDANGCEEIYHFIVDFEVATKQLLNGLELTVFPNPVPIGSPLWLQTDGNGATNFLARLVDVVGREVYSENIKLAGAHRFAMPSAAGIYFLVLENEDGGQAVFKVVVD